MKSFLLKLIIVIGIIGFIIFYVSVANFHPISETDKLIERINKLELKIDSLNRDKDSIRTVIDSTHIKIITNEKHYQERINTIVTQSSSADSSFITNYINKRRSKRDSTNIH